MKTIKKFLYLLSPSEHKKISLLLLMMSLMALLDMIGVASILPFMAVLTNPEIIETNIILNNTFQLSKKEPLSSLKICGSIIIKPSMFVLVIFIFVMFKYKKMNICDYNKFKQ